MKFTLTNNVPITIEDLITNAGYLVKQRPVDSTLIVKVSHTIDDIGTQVYYEGAGTELSSGVFVNSTESNYLTFGDFIEFSIEWNRLGSFWLLACCSDTDIFITLI